MMRSRTHLWRHTGAVAAVFLCVSVSTVYASFDDTIDEEELSRSASPFNVGELVNVGDINGDGVADLAGKITFNDGTSFFRAPGKQIIFGTRTPNSELTNPRTLDGTNGFSVVISAADSGLSESMLGAGDINGDGVDDLVVESQNADHNGRENSGAVYVIYGSQNGFPAVVDVADLDGVNGFAIHGATQGDRLGSPDGGNTKDINGDGAPDLLVNASGADPDGQTNAGSAYVLLNLREQTNATLDLARLRPVDGIRIDGTNQFSWFVAEIGPDLNGDGMSEILFEVFESDVGVGTVIGVIYGSRRLQDRKATVDSVRDGSGFIINHKHRVKFLDDMPFIESTVQSYIEWPWTMSGLNQFDFNDDGYADLLYHQNRSIVVRDQSGEGQITFRQRNFVLFGRSEPYPQTVNDAYYTPSTGVIIQDAGPIDYSDAIFASFVGDANGDGIDDVGIGHYGEESTKSYRTVFGTRCALPRVLTLESLDGTNGFEATNYENVVNKGDLNADGFDDWLIRNIELNGETIAEWTGQYIFGDENQLTDRRLEAGFKFRRSLGASGDEPLSLRGRNYGFREISLSNDTAVVLNPARGARLWHAHNDRFAIAGDLSITARLQLVSTGYTPVVAKYARINVSGKAVPAYALETLETGAVRFSWLRNGQRRIDTCETDAGLIKARRDYEITVTRDADTGLARVWVNGHVRQVCNGTSGPLDTTIRNLFIGSWPKGLPAGKTVMELAELKIYSRVLDKHTICH